MSDFYICSSDPEAAAADDLVRVLTIDPEQFCEAQQEQESMPTMLASSVNTSIALADALKEYVGVDADYDVYPKTSAADFFSIRVSNMRRSDGADVALELPPSYSMLLAARVGYIDAATACEITIPVIDRDLQKSQLYIPRKDISTGADLLELSYDNSTDSDTFDITRALYLVALDTCTTRWKATLVGSYDIESSRFIDGSANNAVLNVDKETLAYAQSETWLRDK